MLTDFRGEMFYRAFTKQTRWKPPISGNIAQLLSLSARAMQNNVRRCSMTNRFMMSVAWRDSKRRDTGWRACCAAHRLTHGHPGPLSVANPGAAISARRGYQHQ